MRVFTLLVGALAAGLSAVQAADLPPTAEHEAGLYSSASGQRIAPLVIWDDQPGIVTRAYWKRPWDDRHYFPMTGHKPRSGRRESAHRRRVAAAQAEPFYRGWTNAEPHPHSEGPLK